jgi:hypothetical protein
MRTRTRTRTSDGWCHQTSHGMRSYHSVLFRLEAEVVPVETLSVRCWCTVLPPLIPSSCFLRLKSRCSIS